MCLCICKNVQVALNRCCISYIFLSYLSWHLLSGWQTGWPLPWTLYLVKPRPVRNLPPSSPPQVTFQPGCPLPLSLSLHFASEMADRLSPEAFNSFPPHTVQDSCRVTDPLKARRGVMARPNCSKPPGQSVHRNLGNGCLPSLLACLPACPGSRSEGRRFVSKWS